MDMDEKFDQDDTLTRKITKLEDLGVLDKPEPHEETMAYSRTTTIKTYPFVETKKGGSRLGRLFAWFKKR